MAASITPDQVRILKTMGYQQKTKMVVTLNGSHYEDSTWSYLREIEQRNLKKSQSIIQWAIGLGPGKSLTDGCYSSLMETAKDFIYSLNISQTRRGRAPKATTVLKTHKSLIPLLRWMVIEDILDFSSLTSEKVMKYLTHLQTTTSRFGKPLSEGEIFKRLDVIDKIWKQSDFLSTPLATNPFPHETPYSLSRITKEKQRERKFDFIPDAVAVALGTIAVEYIKIRSDRILAAHEAVKQAYATTLEIYSEAEAYRRARKAANDYDYKYIKEVTKDIGHLRTACYIVIALFSGIRDSEMASLDTGCVEHDLADQYTWIKGYLYKTTPQQKKARWMVPPVTQTAVKVAERLSSKLRSEILQSIQIIETDIKAPLTSGSALKKLTNELQELKEIKNALWLVQSSKLENSIDCNKTIHQQLLAFINDHDIPDHEGKPWHLHPHQFRPTFVRFMVMNAMNLKYLQEHFGHISLDMTAWYDMDDIELTKEIINCYTEMCKETIVEIVDSDHLAGKGGEIIVQKRNEAFRGIIGKSRDHIIKAMADSVTLRSTGVSWCLGDIENGECSGAHGCMIDPSNINKCSQAIVTPEFLPAWQEIKLRNQELLECNDLGVHQKQAIKNFLDSVVTPVINGISD